MAKKTIAELLKESQELKRKEAELKAQMKEKRKIIAKEYIDNMPEEEKQKQIAEAETILLNARKKVETLKSKFKAELNEIKSSTVMAKEILAFVNYKQNHSLPKTKNSFSINGNILTFTREGIKDIAVDITNASWQKVFKQELAKQGINGENRIADNIVYKASLLVKSNTSI